MPAAFSFRLICYSGKLNRTLIGVVFASGNTGVAFIGIAGTTRTGLRFATHQIRPKLLCKPLFAPVRLIFLLVVGVIFAHEGCLLRQNAREKRLLWRLTRDFHIM